MQWWGRSSVVVLGLVVTTAAVLWVGAVRFKDEASAVDCGVPIGAAWHGRSASRLLIDTSRATSGLFGVTTVDEATTTVCAASARERVAIASGAVLVSGAAIVLALRRRRPPMVPAAA